MLFNVLNETKAAKLTAGKHADGRGLWLHKQSPSHGKWVYRYISLNRRREMGLGPWPDVSVKDARAVASDARRLIRLGKDPIDEREKSMRSAKSLTVTSAILGCFDSIRPNLKDNGRAGRWLSPLQNHVIPKIGNSPIEKIDQHEIVAVLEPIWRVRPEAARKAMNRLNLALKYASAAGVDVDLQAPMKARILLGSQKHKVRHIPSMQYAETPKFFRSLAQEKCVSAIALRFLILTLARTSEVRLASDEEIKGNVWSLSRERTKSGRAFRIPLTQSAISTLAEAKKLSPNAHLFTSVRGKPISDMAMSKLMKHRGLVARPHGFRATFRTWAEEQTDFPFEVKESALGHNVDNGVVGAYQRSDRLEKRRLLLESWEAFITETH